MTARTRPPFRADHVGSLLRPPELLRARENAAAGRIDGDTLRSLETTRSGRPCAARRRSVSGP